MTGGLVNANNHYAITVNHAGSSAVVSISGGVVKNNVNNIPAIYQNHSIYAQISGNATLFSLAQSATPDVTNIIKVFYFRYFDFVVPFPEAVSDFRFIGLVIVDVVPFFKILT